MPHTWQTLSSISIVAIHGLGGGPYSTWRDGGTNKVWLRDFLPNDLPDSHIMSFGYNSRWAFSNSASNVEDYARELLEILIARRARVQTESNPLIFICHSLGGLVFKKVSSPYYVRSVVIFTRVRLSLSLTNDKAAMPICSQGLKV